MNQGIQCKIKYLSIAIRRHRLDISKYPGHGFSALRVYIENIFPGGKIEAENPEQGAGACGCLYTASPYGESSSRPSLRDHARIRGGPPLQDPGDPFLRVFGFMGTTPGSAGAFSQGPRQDP
jgi:hypothetical protein